MLLGMMTRIVGVSVGVGVVYSRRRRKLFAAQRKRARFSRAAPLARARAPCTHTRRLHFMVHARIEVTTCTHVHTRTQTYTYTHAQHTHSTHTYTLACDALIHSGPNVCTTTSTFGVRSVGSHGTPAACAITTSSPGRFDRRNGTTVPPSALQASALTSASYTAACRAVAVNGVLLNRLDRESTYTSPARRTLRHGGNRLRCMHRTPRSRRPPSESARGAPAAKGSRTSIALQRSQLALRQLTAATVTHAIATVNTSGMDIPAGARVALP